MNPHYCHNCANTGQCRSETTGRLEPCTYCARPPKPWVVWLTITVLLSIIGGWLWKLCTL